MSQLWRVRGFSWLLPFALAVALPRAWAGAPGVVTIDHAEAVRSTWQAVMPPSTGWVPVKLLDYWDLRWPRHDGVVWYRLHWNQTGAGAPIGLLLDYDCLADAVWVNGSLVHRDARLVEPLSRSWIAPQYFLVDKPLLKDGENTVLVRVSGLADYQPGLGVVRVGEPEAVYRLYRQGMFWRYEIHLFNFAMSAVLGALFLMFWVLRRRESVFAWYALTTLLGAGYAWNYVADSPWPFRDTDGWEAMNAALFFAAGVTFAIFLLRFCERRWRHVEAILLTIAGASLLLPLLAPHFMGVWRNLWNLPGVALYYGAILAFLWHCLRTPRADLRVMGISLLFPLAASMHDLAVFMQWIRGSNYDFISLTSPVTLIGMGFAIAWRFSAAMRRVEGFNLELQREVDTATASLSATLSREHTLALANAHVTERLHLVRDLHDGFGGSLVGAIAQLEHRSSPEAAQVIATLKELRDDLRLIIDTTTHEQDTDLAGLLAPLRYRWNQRLESNGIVCCWRFEDLDGCRLGATRSLDLLRFLQECLTNVLKHSRAACVGVAVVREGRELSIEVRDDGCGFDPAARGAGTGLASLAKRGLRLEGQMQIDTAKGCGTAVRLVVPGLADAPSASRQILPV